MIDNRQPGRPTEFGLPEQLRRVGSSGSRPFGGEFGREMCPVSPQAPRVDDHGSDAGEARDPVSTDPRPTDTPTVSARCRRPPSAKCAPQRTLLLDRTNAPNRHVECGIVSTLVHSGIAVGGRLIRRGVVRKHRPCDHLGFWRGECRLSPASVKFHARVRAAHVFARSRSAREQFASADFATRRPLVGPAKQRYFRLANKSRDREFTLKTP
jgi:hypothetical protein